MSALSATRLFGVAAAGCGILVAPTFAAEVSPADAAYFEQRVLPILRGHCFDCHSHASGKIKGGLAMDTSSGLKQGGASGPVLAPGNPEASLMIRAVRGVDDELIMPPPDKGTPLHEEEIESLANWIQRGAPDPRPDTVGTAASARDRMAEGRRHWAFQPVRSPTVPVVTHAHRVRTPIDAFILARLEREGLAPSPPADKSVLLRRVTVDLTGLPPTASAMAAFLADDSPEAYARVVDRLLESPQYGERWGRYWLDVARYADTTGERSVRNSETRYPYAYTYRDYVIGSFNEDLPYDRFILEQIAADLLPDPRGPEAMAALGFLTVGKRFRNAADDEIDDRIDVVGRGFQGLSVSCARCHDHKFDPIPTEDYYSLHGVFASCQEPAQGPLIGPAPEGEASEDFLRQHARLTAELESFRQRSYGKIRRDVRERTPDYLLAVTEFAQSKRQLAAASFYRSRSLDPNIARQWERELQRRRRAFDPIFQPLFEMAELSDAPSSADEERRDRGRKQGGNPEGAGVLNRHVAAAIAAEGPADLASLTACYGRLFAQAFDHNPSADSQSSDENHSGPAPESAALSAEAEADWEALRQVLDGDNSPVRLDRRALIRLAGQKAQREENVLERKINDLVHDHAGSPARAMAIADAARPRDSFVYVRGQRANRGPVVPRRYLEVLSGEERPVFAEGSGRLELARTLADRNNPLTARVMVNRVWFWHFGCGLVATPSDFGLRGEPPSHPELLDWLAAAFMEGGWSIKKLHRLIVLSGTYRQSSDPRPEALERDPGNTLWWRMNRGRMDFEATRDSLLSVSALLDTRTGGRAVDLTRSPYAHCRTVYGLVDRLDLPDMFRAFDFANPEMSSDRRYQTTVPQQALFLMNHPLVAECARALAGRADVVSMAEPDQRVRRLYALCFQREPAPEELGFARDFLNAPDVNARRSGEGLNAWELYAQVLLQSNEFVFVR